jgi:uncharacterized membrane protein
MSPPSSAAQTPASPADPNAGEPRPDAVVSSLRAVALAALLGLIVLGLAWELWLAPTGSGTLAIKVLPLFFGVAGLLRHRMYTFRWLSLLVWLYFTEGVVRAVTERGWSMALAIIEIVLCLVLFSACAAYIRWRLKHAPRPAPEPA